MSSRALEAIPILNDLIRAEHDNVALIIDKGTALVALGKHAEAINCFDLAERMEPNAFNEATLNANKGYALLKLSLFNDALTCYNRAIELRPDDHSYYDNRAKAYYTNGHLKQALEDFQRSISLHPTYFAFVYCGYISNSLKDYEEAVTYFEKALVVKPNDSTAIDLIISVMLGQGRYKDSLIYLDKAIKLSPDNATLHQKKGIVLCKLGLTKEGIHELEQALRVDPRKEKEIRALIKAIEE